MEAKFTPMVLLIFLMWWVPTNLIAKLFAMELVHFRGFQKDGKDQTTSIVEDGGEMTLILRFGIMKILIMTWM